GRGGLAVRSRLWGRRAPGSKPDSTASRAPFRVRGLLHAKSYVAAKSSPAGVARKFRERCACSGAVL
ncbi:hypothetical protein AVEN_158413-1, partial [Araneus ventricosus]